MEQIFAEGEADGLVAETADRLKGYACSQDSDFSFYVQELEAVKVMFLWKVSNIG